MLLSSFNGQPLGQQAPSAQRAFTPGGGKRGRWVGPKKEPKPKCKCNTPRSRLENKYPTWVTQGKRDKLNSKHLASQPNQPDALKHMHQTCVKGVVSTRGAPGRHRNVEVFDLHTGKVPAVPTTNRRPQNETAHVWTSMCVDKKLCLYTRRWKVCPDSKMNKKTTPP